MTPPRLGIGIIGAGRVGAVLGAVWRAEGHAITGAYAVSAASRARAADLLPGVPLLPVPTIVERSEMLLLAVPDDELGALAAGLADAGIVPGGQLVVHTSGLHGTEILEPLEKLGCLTIAMHPAMTFMGTQDDLPRLIGAPLGITAAPATMPIAQALAVELGGEPFSIAPADRALYHAALSHGANHLVTLVDQAREALRLIGIEDPGGYLRPLLAAALDESLRRGADALTGPVSRGDAGTLARHLDSLREADSAPTIPEGDLESTYRALARATAARAGLDPERTAAIQALLADGDDGPQQDQTAPEEAP